MTPQEEQQTPKPFTYVSPQDHIAALERELSAAKAQIVVERKAREEAEHTLSDLKELLWHDEDEYHEPQTLQQTAEQWVAAHHRLMEQWADENKRATAAESRLAAVFEETRERCAEIAERTYHHFIIGEAIRALEPAAPNAAAQEGNGSFKPMPLSVDPSARLLDSVPAAAAPTLGQFYQDEINARDEALRVEGMEWCAQVVANWKRTYVMPECCDGAQEIALSAVYELIRAEIERRKVGGG